MTSLHFLRALVLSALLSFALSASQQAPITGAVVPFTFRNATLDDIDDITRVNMDAFKRGPSWSYFRQFADNDPNYTWTCQRELFKQLYLNITAGDSKIMKVISVPDESCHRKERVVSFSYWGLVCPDTEEYFSSTSSTGPKLGVFSRPMNIHTLPNSGFDCEAHLDMNMTRIEHFQRAMLEAEYNYLDKPYGTQFRLDLLATHPDWDGNGFAARHLRWGKETLAELNHASENPEHRMPLTLMATPAGYPLYISEGFEGLKNVTVERLDGKGVLWFEVMKYDEED